MEEDLLKYFTGIGTPTTETITPHVVELGYIPTGNVLTYYNTLTTKDGAYFIRYGGQKEESAFENAIEVYSINSIDNEELVYNYNDIKIQGHRVYIFDLHQDEDGRFYGLGSYKDSNNDAEYYLILFNNFIQEGRLKIRKYYTNTTIGLPSMTVFDQLKQVIKKEGSADYYITAEINSELIIFHYKIDITLGNTLETTTYTITNYNEQSYEEKLNIIDDNLILYCFLWDYGFGSTTPFYETQKLVIDTKNAFESSYSTKTINRKNVRILGGGHEKIDSYLFKVPYWTSNGDNYYFSFDLIDLDGEIKTYSYPRTFTYTEIQTGTALFTTNYCLFTLWLDNESTTFKFKYNPEVANDYIVIQGTADFDPYFCRELNQFDLTILVGIWGNTGSQTLRYLKMNYSEGYTTDEAYYNKNFLIPQYLNLYTDPEDETTLVFSRDISNRFLSGNQLSTVYNVPNYLLNNFDITNEKVFGQTTMVIENNLTQIRKNRFESLYLSYLYSIYVIDNTNEDNLTNMEGSNRIADSVWNTLDYMQSPCNKVRVTYEDESQEIKNLEIGDLSNNSYTYTYQVTGNVKKIEYLSQDEQTVYATFRTDLTGTNVIHQTITVEEG